MPRDPYEKIADAAQVHRYTGVAPKVSLHIPWDRVDDFGKLASHAADLGVRIGAINSNVFQDDDYMLGSLTQPGPAGPRARRSTTCSSASTSCDTTGSHDLKLWLPRRPELPGPGRPARPAGPARRRAAARCTPARTPGSGCCWSTSSSSRTSTPPTCPTGAPRTLHCLALGPAGDGRARHRPPRARTRTSSSSSRSCCGPAGSAAFDFNSRFYADDDLMVGAADPFQLFRILRRSCRGNGFDPHLPAVRRVLHARPVPQHRAEDPGPDPLGAERAGGDGQGVAGRRRGAARPRSRPVTCSAPTAC